MTEHGEPQVLRLPTADGGEVEADLVVAAQPWAGAVVCHPHPDHGGDRRNTVVDRIFRALAAAGATVLRFDFRRGGGGTGGEEHDVRAALGEVAGHLGPDVPLWLVGYSFGADIALSVGDARVAGWVAVAPPLRFGSPPVAAGDGGDPRPVLVLGAQHDQFHPPDRLRATVAAWPTATFAVVPGADHFLVGAAERVAATTLDRLRSPARPSGSGGAQDEGDHGVDLAAGDPAAEQQRHQHER